MNIPKRASRHHCIRSSWLGPYISCHIFNDASFVAVSCALLFAPQNKIASAAARAILPKKDDDSSVIFFIMRYSDSSERDAANTVKVSRPERLFYSTLLFGGVS